jgi:hypothetical protein
MRFSGRKRLQAVAARAQLPGQHATQRFDSHPRQGFARRASSRQSERDLSRKMREQ